MSLKLPKTVRVGCFDYNVIFPYKFVEADDRTAQHSFYDLDLRIAGEFIKKRNESKLLVSFLHELIHAIDYSYVLFTFEEEHVNALSNSVFQFLQDNLKTDKWDIPKDCKVNILGHQFIIECGAQFEELDEYASRVDHDSCIIYISNVIKKKAIERAYVFMHILHCLNSMLSIGIEEPMDKFAFAFLDTMDRNNLWKLFNKKRRTK